jgi:uncharacterized protein YjaZ
MIRVEKYNDKTIFLYNEESKYVGTIHLDNTNSIQIKDLFYLHFRKQEMIILNSCNFIEKIIFNIKYLQEFINRCSFNSFDYFDDFLNLLKNYLIRKHESDPKNLSIVEYLKVLED